MFSSNYVYLHNYDTNGEFRSAQNDDSNDVRCVRMFGADIVVYAILDLML